jgi:Xaa-Pro aminopeptidase
MSLPFSKQEFQQRLQKVRERMKSADVSLLLVADPTNIYWLTGIEDWSFYVPQFLLVSAEGRDPVWIGRAMDAPGARLSGWLDADNVIGYPETFIQQPRVHASDWIGEHVAQLGFGNARIGYESDTYYFSPRSLAHLQHALPQAKFVDCDLLVNWARVVKSPAEVGYMRQAARIAEAAMNAAYATAAPGVRQCDVMAEVIKAQTAPNREFGGDMTALSPLVLAGEKASTAHPPWSDERFKDNQIVAFELGGTRRRYNCGLARTIHLGRDVPVKLRDTAKAVEEGMQAVLEVARAGKPAAQLHAAWQAVLSRYGLRKDSRIGYSIGAGFSPDWGEHTMSLRADDEYVLEAGNTLHIILGMWMDGWGMETSETVHVTATGVECLTDFPRDVFVKA